MGYSKKSDTLKAIVRLRLLISNMGKLALVLLSLFLSSSNGLFQDMVETGYVQDPNMVGKLPLEFQEELSDLELEHSDVDADEDIEEDTIDDERSLDADLQMLDPAMRSEIEDYCNTDAGASDKALCSRITTRAAKAKPKKKTKTTAPKKKPKKTKKKPKKDKKKPKKKKPKKKISHRI